MFDDKYKDKGYVKYTFGWTAKMTENKTLEKVEEYTYLEQAISSTKLTRKKPGTRRVGMVLSQGLQEGFR